MQPLIEIIRIENKLRPSFVQSFALSTFPPRGRLDIRQNFMQARGRLDVRKGRIEGNFTKFSNNRKNIYEFSAYIVLCKIKTQRRETRYEEKNV